LISSTQKAGSTPSKDFSPEIGELCRGFGLLALIVGTEAIVLLSETGQFGCIRPLESAQDIILHKFVLEAIQNRTVKFRPAGPTCD
jgi:hypothetical protein